jgi:large subunit ribosomal protein L3
MPCTIVQAGPCVVTQVRTEETDGYAALQLLMTNQTRMLLKPLIHPQEGWYLSKKVAEFKGFAKSTKLGDPVTADTFIEGESMHQVLKSEKASAS